MKVMKSLVLAGAAVAVALSANADLAIDWGNIGGYHDHTDTVGAATVTGGGIYGVLIWTADGSVGPATPSDLAGGGTVIAEEDLAALGGNDWGYGTTISVGPQAFQGGSVYARIFEASDAGSAAVPGVWYYDGPVVAVVDVDKGKVPPDLNQVYLANTDSSVSPYGGDPLNTAQVVPEPTTLALLVVGLGTMLYRRRR